MLFRSEDIPATSWIQLRCKAYDQGNVDAMLDVIQIEKAVSMINDPRKRAAVVLAMLGWDFADIGAAINAYKPGRLLVTEGIREIVKNERRRASMHPMSQAPKA